nr:hypothetical protein CFP56_24829 [Quercus suber]
MEQTQCADKRPIEEPNGKGKKVAKKADRANDMTIALQEYIALARERFNKKNGKSMGSSNHVAQFAIGGDPCSLGRALEVLNQYNDLDDDTYINISEVLQKKKRDGWCSWACQNIGRGSGWSAMLTAQKINGNFLFQFMLIIVIRM